MVADYDAAKVFGEYQDRLDALCDGDEAARLLTLRAAEEGIYRVYTRKSLAKAVYNGQLAPVIEVGLKSYYLIEDVKKMRILPERARGSKSPEEIQQELDRCLSTEWKVRPSHIDQLRKNLALAREAQSIVDEYWEKRSEDERRLTHMQRRLEQPPKVASL